MPVVFLGYGYELIAQPQIQSQRPHHLPVVLEIRAELFLAPIEELDGLMNLSGRKLELGWQVGFHLVHIATQKGVEGAEGVDGVVTAIDLVHDEPHRIVLSTDFETVVAAIQRQAISKGVEVLKKQSAVSGKSHTRDAIAITELSHALAIGYEQQVDAVE